LLIARAVARGIGTPPYRQLSIANIIPPDVCRQTATKPTVLSYIRVQLLRIGARACILGVPKPYADPTIDQVVGDTRYAGDVLAVAKDKRIGGLIQGFVKRRHVLRVGEIAAPIAVAVLSFGGDQRAQSQKD